MIIPGPMLHCAYVCFSDHHKTQYYPTAHFSKVNPLVLCPLYCITQLTIIFLTSVTKNLSQEDFCLVFDSKPTETLMLMHVHASLVHIQPQPSLNPLCHIHLDARTSTSSPDASTPEVNMILCLCVCLSIYVFDDCCVTGKQDLGRGGWELMGGLMMRFPGDWYNISVCVYVCACRSAMIDSIHTCWSRQTDSAWLGWLCERWLHLHDNTSSGRERH